MTVFRTRIFTDSERGAGMSEVLLSMAIIAIATPFLYRQINNATHDIRNMAMAKNIIELRGDVLNFVRINQDKWPDVAQIKLADAELSAISDAPVAGFIDKYTVRGATITDVYLSFDLGSDLLHANQVARHIGGDAAVVADDGVAYGDAWAVAAPDFAPGHLIYRVSRDVAGDDKSKFLHRGSVGELNTMLRDLHMGGHDLLNVGTIANKSARIKNATATFITTETLGVDNLYYSSGAILDDATTEIGTLRVTGDIAGFRNIYADNMNGAAYTTSGRIITDRATVVNSVNVSRDFVLKSDTLRTVNGFTGISANSVLAPYISTEEIIFHENFGLTISGELLMSTTPPLKIGNWTFPTTTPPRFTKFKLTRAKIPSAPNRSEFGPLMTTGWQSVPPINVIR